MFKSIYVYYYLCIVWGLVSGIIERHFGLFPLSVCAGAGLPFLIIFKPWKYFEKK